MCSHIHGVGKKSKKPKIKQGSMGVSSWNLCLGVVTAVAVLQCSVFVVASAAANAKAEDFFPDINNAAAGNPTELWAESRARAPLPTNAFWMNYVLQDGSQPEYIHPYSVRSTQGLFSVCYPKRLVQPNALSQVHSDDLTISCKEETGKAHLVTDYDDLSVTLMQGSRLSVPLVRGSPYVTFVFAGGTPVFSTIDAVLNLSSNSDNTKHRLLLNNGQTWIMYSSSPLEISSKDLSTGGRVFTGVIRVAVVPEEASESVLDRFSSCYPLRGTVEFPSPFQIVYNYTTTMTKTTTTKLLMLSLPMHRSLMISSSSSAEEVPAVNYMSIDGRMQGVVGTIWTMRASPLNVSWYSNRGLQDPSAAQEIASMLQQDVEDLPAIISNSSTYFFGKAAARAARLALIAQELHQNQLLDKIRSVLASSLSPWFDDDGNGTYGNGIGYDRTWGGLVSRFGATDSGSDFGLGVYNDHHYHWGYFVYAGAVLAKLDLNWGRRYRCRLYSLVADYLQHDQQQQHDQHFPRVRHFDPWVMHSWAGGLNVFADGRNQESTSEAVNAYYAASLLGNAFGDQRLVDLGLTLVAFEAFGAQSLWHISQDSSLYEPEFVRRNRMVGVLWANKRDTALWFAPPQWLDVRLGIQTLPITPVTELLFLDLGFNKEVVEWAMTAMDRPEATDGWKGFVYSLQAGYDPTKALSLARQLKGFDDGNSASNLLWWIHTRPPNP